MPSSGCQKSARSEEHTSELQSHSHLVCRLLLEKTKSIMIAPGDLKERCKSQKGALRADVRGGALLLVLWKAHQVLVKCAVLPFFFFFKEPAPPVVSPFPPPPLLPV